MNDVIEIIRGRTLLIEGEWPDGEEFTNDTSLSAVLQRKDVPDIVVTVSKTGPRLFRIYASAAATTGWQPGVYDAILNRTDAGFFSNGDDFVHGPEKFNVKVI